MKSGFGQRWTRELKRQYNPKLVRRLLALMLALLVVAFIFAFLGYATFAFGCLTFDFFLFADYLTNVLARHSIHIVFSILLGTLGGAVAYGIAGLFLMFLSK